jgi:hypothetical protein
VYYNVVHLPVRARQTKWGTYDETQPTMRTTYSEDNAR